ncbi:MAG: PASTA domain-containing protein [Clostridia bacterium]|nr:PASTA domain-containing protein [Clostridia bacterium]
MRKTEENRSSAIRAAVIGTVLLALLIVVIGRIFYLQTVREKDYSMRAVREMVGKVEATPLRGDIKDSNGQTLATNIVTYRVFIAPANIYTAQTSLQDGEESADMDYPALITDKLSELLEVDPEFIRENLTYTRALDRTIARNVSEDKALEIKGFIAEYGLEQMIYLEAQATRYYPYGSLASHVIGFTSGATGSGLYGLEYQYNQMLTGTAGRYVSAYDAKSNEMPYAYEVYVEAEDGYDLHTTLNTYVQNVVERELEKAYLESGGQNRGCAIVMDVNTGGILALAVYPYFDLNHPRDLTGQYEQLLAESGLEEGSEEYIQKKGELQLLMWSNKAITEGYIPGSTFKVITSAVSLEEKLFDLNSEFYCKGYLNVNGSTIHCAEVNGQGHLTFGEAIQVSCNPALMTIGLKIGVDKFYEYFQAFGYRDKTGIDLPGEQFSESWFWSEDTFKGSDIYLATASFGQNFNTTAIQQITAISAVANGGKLVTPHVVESITNKEGNTVYAFDADAGVRRQLLSEDVCSTISEILRQGVAGNGGGKNTYVAGYRVAAKTGTSEKRDNPGYYVCSTVAYAPADDPQYAMILIVDEPTKGVLYGSYAAAPYIANTFKDILPYLGVKAEYTEAELDKMSVKVPSVTYWSVNQAVSLCEKYNYKIEIIGEGEVVKAQLPVGGSEIESLDKTIVLYTETSEPTKNIMVPSLTGMTASAAYNMMHNMGLNVRIEGSSNYLTGTEAIVVSQSPVYGTMLARGDVVTLTFRYSEQSD